MRRADLVFAFACLAAGCARTPSAPTTPEPAPEQAVTRDPTDAERALLASLITQTETLRGHRLSRGVPLQILNRVAMGELFGSSREHDPDDTQERLYAALGMIPESYRFEIEMPALHAEQAIGAYHSLENRMVVRDDVTARLGGDPADAIEPRLVLIHEITHAIQHDPSFVRVELAEGEEPSNVEASLREGDATFVMVLAMARSLGVDPRRLVRSSHFFDEIIDDAVTHLSPADGARLAAAPPIIRLWTVAPYVQGARFVASVYVDGGMDAVDALYRTPPASMEQVLHPEKFAAGEEPEAFEWPSLETLAAHAYDTLRSEPLGELDFLAFFEPVGAEVDVARAAAGWSQDRAILLRAPNGDSAAVWMSVWDSVRDAVEAADASRRVAASSSRPFTVHRRGRALVLCFALPDERRTEIESALDAFAERTIDPPLARPPTLRR